MRQNGPWLLLLVARPGAAQFEFAIIGAQKAGTTGLRNALALDHPSTCVPSEHSALDCARAAAPCEYHQLESAAFRRAPDWAAVARWSAAACANKTAPLVRGFDDPFLVYRAPELAPSLGNPLGAGGRGKRLWRPSDGVPPPK